MEREEFAAVAGAFAAFHRGFAPLFRRRETARRSKQYLTGLLVQGSERRNAENLAEAVEGATPRALQRLLTEAAWSDRAVRDRLQGYLAGRLSEDGGVFILDETGFAKQGRKSAGVARQYSGTLGKVGNCQVGVFLAYAGARGHALVDAALYLPEAWAADRARCDAAGVPPGVGYASKAELGLALLRHARALGALAGRWVTADEGYGRDGGLRDALDADGWWYVLEVPTTTPVFAAPPALVAAPRSGRRGPAPTRQVLDPRGPQPQPVAAVLAGLPPGAWRELTVAEGAQGPRRYQFAAVRVWESRAGLPGRACWLLLRRNLDGTEPKHYLSNAPADTPPLALAQVSAARWRIETGFEQGKGEAGLDEYEVRSWGGWHRHVALALLAAAFLLALQQDWGGKGGPADADPPPGRPPAAPPAAPPSVDARRPLALAPRHAVPQRASDARPRRQAGATL
jgi:SRSO17 transposase